MSFDDAAVARLRAAAKAGPGRTTAVDVETLQPALTLELALLLLAGTGLGAVLAAVILPALLPDLAGSLLGDQPKAYWYVSRASGVVAYLLLWLAGVLGLTLTNRFARLWANGPVVADLHQFVSLLGLALLALHVLILLGDRYAGYRLDQLLVPFTATQHEPFWVGLGQIAGCLALPVTFSFYARRQIGVRAWRLIHYLGFGVFWLSVAHGLGAGTDSVSPIMLSTYIVTSGTIVLLTTYRVLIACTRQMDLGAERTTSRRRR